MILTRNGANSSSAIHHHLKYQHIEITCLPSQNNEKVVLVVARRKGNYASSQSTAITAQRDETDGAVPGPQSSGKVVGRLFLVGRIFLKTGGKKFRDSN